MHVAVQRNFLCGLKIQMYAGNLHLSKVKRSILSSRYQNVCTVVVLDCLLFIIVNKL